MKRPSALALAGRLACLIAIAALAAAGAAVGATASGIDVGRGAGAGDPGDGSARVDGPAAPQVADLRISQVYGGGGNTGAPLMCDFIEILNAGATTLSVNGWSVQYTSSAGTTWQATPLAGSIAPGRYYLVQEACGANGVALPAPDATGTIAMSATTGKVALVSSTTLLTGQGLGDPTVVDFVGFGTPSSCEGSPPGTCTTPAPTLSNTLAALRGNDGCTDTDNNMADFTAAAPSPRNSSSPPKSCGVTVPTATPSPTPFPTPEFLAANTSFTLADPFDCTAAGDVLDAELVFTNSGQATAFGVVLDVPLPALLVGRAGSCVASGGQNGQCTIDAGGLTWTGDVPAAPPANVVAVNFKVRVAGGTTLGSEMCVDAVLNYARIGSGPNDSRLPISQCATVDCLPTVDPNRQLGGQVHLPILDFQGQDDVCNAWIEVQLLGCDPSKAVLVAWGAPGFCPPQAAGPLKVECTGLLVPGTSWLFHDAQVPTGAKSGILFKFTARKLSEVGIDLGFEDVVADLLCEELFFGLVGDADDYRRFKQAYNDGLEFRGIPLRLAIGDGYLAVEVLRRCPGDLTPGSIVSSKYNGIAGTHLGTYDPVYGGFGYYAPLIYAGKAGFTTILYVQNGGIECSSIEIWFKAQDDCLRARICDVATLAPGETYQYDASDCVGPDWQGSAWLRSSEPMGIAVDIIGRDVLMTYIAEPEELSFLFDPEHPYASEGNRVAFGPLVYSEYQGWDSGIQVQNLDAVYAAKVKVYFLDRSGDVIQTLVDWVCPRGSQTFFLPSVHNLPGNWVGSVRVESQDWWTPGTSEVHAGNIVGIAQLMKYKDAGRTETVEALAYNLVPEHKVFDWQIGANAGGVESGVGLIAIPSLIKDVDGQGVTSELSIQNAVPKAGFTDFAIYIFDQNGLIDFVCQKLHDRQVEYIDLQAWGYIGPGFKGSAIISATYWEHDVFDGGGFFLRNLLGLAAVSIERSGTRLGQDVPGDEAAGERGIPFTQAGINDPFVYCFAGPAVAFCPGQPGTKPTCPDKLVLTGQGGEIPDDRAGGEVFTSNITVNFPSVPGLCKVEDVNLFLNVEHDETRDLDAFLDHTDLRSEMFADVCFDDEGVLVTLDDDDPDHNGPIGNTASCAGTGPVGGGGTYTTMSGTGLEDFEGADPRGQWSLVIDDDFQTTFGFGRVVEWKLILDIGTAP